MSDRVNRDSDYWPGKFTARLAKALEEEASFPCHQDAIQSQPVPTASIRTEHDGSLSSKEGQVGNRHGSKVLYKPSRDLAIVDGLSSTQYRHLQPAIQQYVPPISCTDLMIIFLTDYFQICRANAVSTPQTFCLRCLLPFRSP